MGVVTPVERMLAYTQTEAYQEEVTARREALRHRSQARILRARARTQQRRTR